MSIVSDTKTPRPLIAITLGDPAGVGPEIIVAAWTEPVVHQLCRPIGRRTSGDSAVVPLHCGMRRKVVEIDSPDQARSRRPE